jgi:hypothetical protein
LRILDFGADVGGLAIGVVIGATREAVGWLNANLGPGVTIGIVSGIAVFAAASTLGASSAVALHVGSVAGVAVGALTTVLISTRSLQQPEIDEARKVFADTIPYDKVTLTNLGSLGDRAFTAPGVDGRLYVNLGAAFLNPLGSHPPAYPGAGELLMHELTHAWQIANAHFLPGFVSSGIVNQADYQFGDDVYKYGPAGPGWSALNLEQQGAIVNGWYAGSNDRGTLQGSYRAMDTATNPYYVYIRDNILRRNAG